MITNLILIWLILSLMNILVASATAAIFDLMCDLSLTKKAAKNASISSTAEDTGRSSAE